MNPRPRDWYLLATSALVLVMLIVAVVFFFENT